MTIKKSLLAAATATTLAVAVAGTSIASADPELPTTGNGSSESSLEGADLSGQASTAFGSVDDDGIISLEQSVVALLGIATAGGAVAGSIAVLPAIYSAVQDFQDMVDDISGNLPALPF